MSKIAPPPPLFRSLLFVPGNRADMLEKALGLRPDVFVPDLEDSVPTSEKHHARMTVASFMERLSDSGRPVVPRVNALGSEFIDDDLAAVIGRHSFGVSVGKIGSAADLASLDEKIARAEATAGVEVGSTRVFAWLETAVGIVNAGEICRSKGRLLGVAFGAEDLTSDMEMPRLIGEQENPALSYPRSAIAIAARAGGVLALDTPYFGYRDVDGLERDCARARSYGFVGKFAIHPNQIEAINRAFSPSDAEVGRARREIAVFEEAERAGRGSTSLDGQVIDVPVVERARKLIRRHETVRAQE